MRNTDPKTGNSPSISLVKVRFGLSLLFLLPFFSFLIPKTLEGVPQFSIDSIGGKFSTQGVVTLLDSPSEVVFQGSAVPGSLITLIDNGTPAGVAISETSGIFSVTLSLGAGQVHEITATFDDGNPKTPPPLFRSIVISPTPFFHSHSGLNPEKSGDWRAFYLTQVFPKTLLHPGKDRFPNIPPTFSKFVPMGDDFSPALMGGGKGLHWGDPQGSFFENQLFLSIIPGELWTPQGIYYYYGQAPPLEKVQKKEKQTELNPRADRGDFHKIIFFKSALFKPTRSPGVGYKIATLKKNNKGTQFFLKRLKPKPLISLNFLRFPVSGTVCAYGILSSTSQTFNPFHPILLVQINPLESREAKS